MKNKLIWVKKYYNLIAQIASIKYLITLLLLTAISIFVLFPIATRNRKILDTRFFYNHKSVEKYIETLSQRERVNEVLIHFSLDIVHPIAYTLLFSITIFLLLSKLQLTKNQKRGEIITSIPLIIMLIDYIENILIAILLLRYPKHSPILADTAGIVTALKWSLVGLTVLGIILSFVLGTIRKGHKKDPNPPQ